MGFCVDKRRKKKLQWGHVFNKKEIGMKTDSGVHSVALLLTNSSGLVYGVRELLLKEALGKIPGIKDYSFPWETRNPKERILLTLHRLIREEIDATDRVEISFPVYIGHVPVYDTTAHVFLSSYLGGPENMRGSDAGVEIEPLGWCEREFLLARCRDGVPEVFKLWDEYRAAVSSCDAVA